MFFTSTFIKLKEWWNYFIYPSKYYAKKYAKEYSKYYAEHPEEISIKDMNVLI